MSGCAIGLWAAGAGGHVGRGKGVAARSAALAEGLRSRTPAAPASRRAKPARIHHLYLDQGSRSPDSLRGLLRPRPPASSELETWGALASEAPGALAVAAFGALPLAPVSAPAL